MNDIASKQYAGLLNVSYDHPMWFYVINLGGYQGVDK